MKKKKPLNLIEYMKIYSEKKNVYNLKADAIVTKRQKSFMKIIMPCIICVCFNLNISFDCMPISFSYFADFSTCITFPFMRITTDSMGNTVAWH